MQTTAKQFRLIPVHQAAHFDEAVGVFLAKSHGEQKRPGLSSAQVRLVQKDPIGGDERFDREGMYPVGCGRGRCDDKSPDGKRKEGKCSALLVAEDLGVDNDPVYKQLLSETLACDSKGGVRSTQLPEIIKMGNACFGKTGEEFILKWSMSVVAAIVEQSANGYAPVSGEKSARDVFEHFVKEGKFRDEKAIAYIRKQLERGEEHHESVTELDYICRAMQRCTKADDAEEFVLFALTRLYDTQLRMQALVDDYRSGKATDRGHSEEFPINAVLGGQERRLRAILIHSDESFAHRAAAYLGYNITAVRRSSGNVQLFASGKVQHLSLGTTVAMLRWLDGDASVKSLPFNDLTDGKELFLSAEGEVLGVSHWHYFKAAEQVFNGSATHTDVPATEICSQAIIDVLRCAFIPVGSGSGRRNGASEGSKKSKRETSTAETIPSNSNKVAKRRVPKAQRGFANSAPSLTKRLGHLPAPRLQYRYCWILPKR